jgi:hypothetical protein
MTNLPPVVKVSSPRPELPPLIKVDNKVYKVRA